MGGNQILKMVDAKKHVFRKFSYKGIDLEQLLEMKTEKLLQLFTCRIRRKFQRGLKHGHLALIKKLRKAKMANAGTSDKPVGVKTHIRDMIIVPEMIGSILGIYNGKTYTGVEIKPEMIGMYLGEFSFTYKPVAHGRPGVGVAQSSRFVPF